jgi:hypothetical protein
MKPPILESKHVELPTTKWCKDRGIINRKMNGLGFAGWPDRMFLMPKGKIVFIEFKKPGGSCTELQLYVQDKLRKLGYQVHVCETKEHAIEILSGNMEAGSVPTPSRGMAARPRRGRNLPRPRTR